MTEYGPNDNQEICIKRKRKDDKKKKLPRKLRNGG